MSRIALFIHPPALRIKFSCRSSLEAGIVLFCFVFPCGRTGRSSTAHWFFLYCIHPVDKYHVVYRAILHSLLSPAVQTLDCWKFTDCCSEYFLSPEQLLQQCRPTPPSTSPSLFLFSSSAFFTERLLCFYSCCVPAAVWTSGGQFD